MKTVMLIIRQTEISKIFPNGLQVLLEDDASTLDAIKVADDEIKRKCGNLKNMRVYCKWFTIQKKTDSTSKSQYKLMPSRKNF